MRLVAAGATLNALSVNLEFLQPLIGFFQAIATLENLREPSSSTASIQNSLPRRTTLKVTTLGIWGRQLPGPASAAPSPQPFMVTDSMSITNGWMGHG